MSDESTAAGGATPPDGPTPEGATSDGQTDAQREAGDGPDAGTLGDKGKAALERERNAKREAEQRAREAEGRAAETERRLHELEDAGKSEVERAIARLDRQAAELEQERTKRNELEQELARRELLDLKREIALELGIPSEAAHRLQGTDARSLRADAQRYLDERGRQAGDIGVGRGGAAGARPATDMNRLLREAAGRRD